jgi:hypothetical protein
MTSYFYRATVDEAERIIKMEKIEAKQSGGGFNYTSGPYFSLASSIPVNSWLNPLWPALAGSVLFDFTSNLPVTHDYNTTTYAGLIGSGGAKAKAGHVLEMPVAHTPEVVATIVTPQQGGLQLKGVSNLKLLSSGAQKKVAEMTAPFADRYIDIA